MSFISFPFVLFFAVLSAAYFLLPRRCQWPLLLVFSVVFYLAADARYAVFLLVTVVSAYIAVCRMDSRLKAQERHLAENKSLTREEKKSFRAGVKHRNRITLTVCLVLNFSMLFFCKVLLLPGAAAAAEGTCLSFLSLGLPLGMSFYLFQSMGYCIDVYRGKAKAQRNFFRFALFTTYFPYLIQGPINSYAQLGENLWKPHDFDGKQWSFGLQRMLWGYFKKLVIADRIAPMVAALRAPELGGTGFFLLTLSYALQIYGDFTGGIDITIGMSQCLGIPLRENFLRPYFSKNIAEYWRRWHISLGEWMKDYIFYPISVSAPMLRLSKAARARFGNFGKRLPVYVASVATWLVTGIWHGLTPNFILWGMLNCFFIVGSEELSPLYERFHGRFHWKDKAWYGWFEILRMFLLMNFIRACDLFPHVGDYFAGFGRMVLNPNFTILTDGTMLTLGLTALDFGILGVGIVLLFAVSLYQEKRGSVREMLWGKNPWVRYSLLFILLLAVLLLGKYGTGYNASSFIYNQF